MVNEVISNQQKDGKQWMMSYITFPSHPPKRRQLLRHWKRSLVMTFLGNLPQWQKELESQTRHEPRKGDPRHVWTGRCYEDLSARMKDLINNPRTADWIVTRRDLRWSMRRQKEWGGKTTQERLKPRISEPVTARIGAPWGCTIDHRRESLWHGVINSIDLVGKDFVSGS